MENMNGISTSQRYAVFGHTVPDVFIYDIMPALPSTV